MFLRPLLFLTFAGLLLLPDWSTARPFRRWVNSPQVFSPVAYSYPAPVTYTSYSVPVSYASCPAPVVYSQPVYSQPCPPMFLSPVVDCPPVTPAPRGPTVVPERMADPKAVEPKPPVTTLPPAEPKVAPPVIRQAGNEERLPPMPVPVPPRPVVDPLPALPKMSVELAPPKAITEESHKPAAKPDPLPAFPLPAKDPEPASDLPKFDLPPLPPLAPPTTAKSSPLNGDGVADVYPTAGAAPADRAAKRSVGFVNKSDRDVILTVAGKMTTLPSGQYLQVMLPAKFAWQIGGEKEREVVVPDSAPGVDVVIRR